MTDAAAGTEVYYLEHIYIVFFLIYTVAGMVLQCVELNDTPFLVPSEQDNKK